MADKNVDLEFGFKVSVATSMFYTIFATLFSYAVAQSTATKWDIENEAFVF